MKEFLSEKKVKFAYFDISKDFGALKRFLKLRDNKNEYNHVKEQGSVGVPTIIIDDEIIIGFQKNKIEDNID